MSHFEIFDPDINFSDHLPLFFTVTCHVPLNGFMNQGQSTPAQCHPRWDKADLFAYYQFTGNNFVPLLTELDSILASNNYDNNCIDLIYNSVISVLIDGEAQFVPKSSKTFYKSWGDEELDILKQAAVESNNLINRKCLANQGLVLFLTNANQLE